MSEKDFTGGRVSDAQPRIAAGDQTTPAAIRTPIANEGARPGLDHQQAIGDTPSILRPPAGSSHPPTIRGPFTSECASAGSNSTISQSSCGDHTTRADRGLTPGGHNLGDTQQLPAAGSQAAEGHLAIDIHSTHALGPILDDPLLGTLAEVVDDLEKVRCANENRLRALTDTSELGHGLSLHNPDVARLAANIDALAATEHQAILNLQRAMRQHPLWLWAKPIRGLGEKQFARLLASIGDPYWNDLHNRPRLLSELRAYCGYHVLHTGGHRAPDTQNRLAAGVAPKRQRGQKSNWNEDARKRAWLIATSCMKQPKGSHYRDVYDATRAKYAEAVHTSECVRCGPKGKPAQVGSPLSLAHQHARGLRAVAKELLADLWREAKRLHEAQVGAVAA